MNIKNVLLLQCKIWEKLSWRVNECDEHLKGYKFSILKNGTKSLEKAIDVIST